MWGTGEGRVVKWKRKARVSYIHCRTNKGISKASGTNWMVPMTPCAGSVETMWRQANTSP